MPVQFDSSYPTVTVWADFPSPVGSQDITEYVITARTFNGRLDELERFDANATLVLDNWDGRFTPGDTTGPYVSGGVSFVRPKVPIRITAEWSSTTYNVWRGRATAWTEDWKGDAEVEGFDSRTVLSCEGLYSLLVPALTAGSLVGAFEFGGARVSRILTAAGWSGGTSLATGAVPLEATDLGGSPLDLILAVCDADGGWFYIEPDGTAVFEDRGSLVVTTRSNTSQATFSEASLFFRDANPSVGFDRIANDVTMTGASGTPQRVTDSTSIAAYGTQTYERTTPTSADSDLFMLGTAAYNLARWKDPDRKVPALTVDPVSAPSTMWPQALGRRIHDRVTVTAYNALSTKTVSHQAFIEGIEHSFAMNHWETRFAFSSATATAAMQGATWGAGTWDTARWFF